MPKVLEFYNDKGEVIEETSDSYFAWAPAGNADPIFFPECYGAFKLAFVGYSTSDTALSYIEKNIKNNKNDIENRAIIAKSIYSGSMFSNFKIELRILFNGISHNNIFFKSMTCNFNNFPDFLTNMDADLKGPYFDGQLNLPVLLTQMTQHALVYKGVTSVHRKVDKITQTNFPYIKSSKIYGFINSHFSNGILKTINNTTPKLIILLGQDHYTIIRTVLRDVNYIYCIKGYRGYKTSENSLDGFLKNISNASNCIISIVHPSPTHPMWRNYFIPNTDLWLDINNLEHIEKWASDETDLDQTFHSNDQATINALRGLGIARRTIKLLGKNLKP